MTHKQIALPQVPDDTCPICRKSFKGFQGMRQHMSLAHKELYNAEMEQESEINKRSKLRSDIEIIKIAKIEAAFSGFAANLHTYLATIPK